MKKLNITKEDQVPNEVRELGYGKKVMDLRKSYKQFEAYHEYGLHTITTMVANFEAKLKEVQERTELVDEGSYQFYKYSKIDKQTLSLLLKNLNENIKIINSKYPEVPNKQAMITVQDL